MAGHPNTICQKRCLLFAVLMMGVVLIIIINFAGQSRKKEGNRFAGSIMPYQPKIEMQLDKMVIENTEQGTATINTTKQLKEQQIDQKSEVATPTSLAKNDATEKPTTSTTEEPTASTTEEPTTSTTEEPTTSAPQEPTAVLSHPSDEDDHLKLFLDATIPDLTPKKIKDRAKVHLDTCHSIFMSNDSPLKETKPLNTLFLFTGRWHFLRVLIPQIYRELRRNGGSLDRVWFMLMKHTKEGYDHLVEFANAANRILKEEVFIFHDYKTFLGKKPYGFAYCEVLANILQNPGSRFIKLDDDVVYIDPGAFGKVIEYKDKHPECLIGLFNTAGGNWMCNRIYQTELKAFEGLTVPGKVDFTHVHGEGSGSSAAYSLRSFLHYKNTNSLDKLFFESRPHTDRFTMNGALFDRNSFRMEVVKKAGTMNHDKDEPYWTKTYPKSGGEYHNCLVGNALIVHFSHSRSSSYGVKVGILDEFEKVVLKEKENMKMEDELWSIIGYNVSGN